MFHMEQKDYKLEIIQELLKNPSHVRALAKSLETNHMQISRKIKSLQKENIVDYKEQGKNKIFFLKNTIEAKSYVHKTEHYKLIKTLKKYPKLRSIIEKIQSKQKIKLAILFGSYAKHIAKESSDIDIYIETSNHKIKEEIKNLNTKLSIKIGKYNKSNLLIKEIEKNHVILKGIETYYEKNKFFN